MHLNYQHARTAGQISESNHIQASSNFLLNVTYCQGCFEYSSFEYKYEYEYNTHN